MGYLPNEAPKLLTNINMDEVEFINNINIPFKWRVAIGLALPGLALTLISRHHSKVVLCYIISIVYTLKLTARPNLRHFIYFSSLPEIWALSKRFKARDIGYIELASFLSDTSRINCAEYVCTYEIVKEYAEIFTGISANRYTFMFSNRDIIKKGSKLNDLSQQIVFFASGYYKRVLDQSHNLSFLQQAELMEKAAITRICKDCIDRGIEFYIAPHYARGVEDPKSADSYYSSIPGVSAEAVLPPDFDKLTFTGTSVTLGSNAFFDMFSMGKKSLIFPGAPHIEKQIKMSKLRNYIYEPETLIENTLSSNFNFHSSRLIVGDQINTDRTCI